MATDFGTDWSCELDLDPYGRTASGVEVVRQAAVRRLTSPLGSMLLDPLYGFDLATLLGKAGSQTTIVASAMVPIRQQLLRDERVLTVRLDQGVYSASTGALRLDITATTAAGPFSLVFTLSPAGIQVLTA